MSGDTFTPYYGEFLVSPVPIELSFNWCSHDCGYCFANLNSPTRKADISATMKLLSEYRRRSTLVSTLLREKYPTLISNRVDPFAATNYRQFLPVLELMIALELPVSIQTKGGHGVDEALAMLPPSVWYITIETDSDSFSKKLAPGAPKFSDRLDLIDRLRLNDHEVIVGINPAVSEWISDPMALLQKLKSLGVHGVWAQALHFNSTQRRRLSDKAKNAMGEELIAEASSKCNPGKAFVDELLDQAQEIGLEPYAIGQSRYSDFFAPFRRLYPKTFPIMQDLVNLCHRSNVQSPISFDQFRSFFAPSLPDGVHQTGHYICSANYSICKEYASDFPDGKWNHNQTYSDILRLAWNDNRIKFSPGKNYAFAYLIDTKDRDLIDENGDALMTFIPHGSDRDDYAVSEKEIEQWRRKAAAEEGEAAGLVFRP